MPKVGIKMFEGVYLPEIHAMFDAKIEIVKNRLEHKRHEIWESLREQLPIDNISERITSLLSEAEQKEQMAQKLEKEATKLREKAEVVTRLTKTFTVDAGGSGYRAKGVDEIIMEPSAQMKGIMNIAMVAQMEYLDEQELEALKTDYVSKLRQCVTIEKCVEVIEAAKGAIANLDASTQGGR